MNRFDDLSLEVPIILAGMAGGPTTPQLVAAVSNAGGLGTIGAGYLSPASLTEQIRAVKMLTDRPFCVNLFIPEDVTIDPAKVETSQRLLAPIRAQLGLPPQTGDVKPSTDLSGQLAVVLEERVAVCGFTFGVPEETVVAQLHEAGICVIGTATSSAEAIQLACVGVDAIVAQGAEAGGHRGSFDAAAADARIGTMALVPQVCDAVQVPVIAAGGIADGRGIAAAVALGAKAVQIGTAFLTASESGASALHRKSIRAATDTSTCISVSATGKPVRGFKTKMMTEFESMASELPPYPIQNALTSELRKQAVAQGRFEWTGLWAGQAAPLSEENSADALVTNWMEQANSVASSLHDTFLTYRRRS